MGRPKDPSEKKSEQFLLKLKPKQAEILRQLAGDEPIEPVAWIRRLVLRELARQSKTPIRGNVSTNREVA